MLTYLNAVNSNPLHAIVDANRLQQRTLTYNPAGQDNASEREVQFKRLE
jgi:hypothetical protein